MQQKLLINEELTEYFEEDAEVLEQIEEGEISSALLRYDIEKGQIEYAILHDNPEEVNFANVDNWREDDFREAIKTSVISAYGINFGSQIDTQNYSWVKIEELFEEIANIDTRGFKLTNLEEVVLTKEQAKELKEKLDKSTYTAYPVEIVEY